MNERIKKLEKQSYTEFMHEHGGRYMAFDKQKFAELIVRECALWIELQDEAEHPTAWLLSEELEKHFRS